MTYIHAEKKWSSSWFTEIEAYLSLDRHNRRKLFFACIAIIVINIALYCTFLFLTISSVVARKGSEEKNRIVASEVSTLEESYLRESKAIHIGLLPAYNLVEAHAGIVYAYAKESPQVGMISR